MQILIGRYQGKVLLMYDEIRLLVLSHVGFFHEFLVFPFYSWTFRKLYGFVFLTIFCFVLQDLVPDILINGLERNINIIL